MTTGKTLTLKGTFDQSATLEMKNTGLSADSKTIAVDWACTDDCTITGPAATSTLAILGANTFTAGQIIGAGAAAAGYVELREGTDNGSNYTRVAGLAAQTGDNTLVVGKTYTDGKWCSYATATGFTCNEDAPAGSGDVTDVGNCSSGNCLDGTSDGGTQILFYDAQGATTLAVGDNAGAVALTLPITTGTLALVDSQVFTTYIEAPYLILGSAATAADAGAIRMPNATYIMAEADGAGTDISVIGVDSGELIQIGASGASGVTITPLTTVTGGIVAPTPVIDDPDNFAANFTAGNLYGGTFICNAAGTAALPNATAGMNFTIVLEGTGATVIEPYATGTDDAIFLNGTELTTGHNITSSTSGAMCVFQYRSADHWMATCNGFVDGT
jgi:hypothetical protein